MIVRLLGLNHGHQLQGYALGDWRAFDAYLSEFCVVNKIDLIGEELSEEALALWHATDSVARTVAVRLLIEHLFCDPESEERHRLGILTDKEAAAKTRIR